MRAKVLRPELLDGERDAAGPVGQVIAVAAPLESLVLDVVTQELVVGAPPLHGQLGQCRAVLVGIGTRQREPTTWLAGDSRHSSCKQSR